MKILPIVVAIGVFVGNWLVVPLFCGRTFTEGFYIGLIAAALVLSFYWMFPKE